MARIVHRMRSWSNMVLAYFDDVLTIPAEGRTAPLRTVSERPLEYPIFCRDLAHESLGEG